MSRVLITNGDHAANALAAHFPDAEILIWRDVLVEGPVPGGIDDEALADIRAEHIETAFGVNDVRADFTRRNAAFANLPTDTKIELWFETDLHDQLQIIELLSRFADKPRNSTLLLAQCKPPLSAHIDDAAATMRAITTADCDAARAMWFAFRAPSPEALHREAMNAGLLSDVRIAFQRLLEEYPAPADGLGRIERNALRAIRDGALTPGLAFRHYQQTEPLPFLGDLGFYFRLEGLAAGKTPLLTGLLTGGVAHAARNNMTVEYTETLIELTDAGHAVLEGRKDFIALNGIDRWIGGVHLTSEKFWRYDPAAKTLARG